MTIQERGQEIISYYKNMPYQTQAQQIYDMLLELIALDELPAKRIYTELELTQMLETGRTPLRDALRLLEFDSIIETIPRHGVQIRELHIEDYFLQTEVRTTLEHVVIRRACMLIRDDERQHLQNLNREFENADSINDRRGLYRQDRSIHALVDECCRNPYAVRALTPLRFYEQRVHYLLGRIYPEIDDILNREHVRFVNDIVLGNAESACQHFDNMIESTLNLVKRQVDAHMGNIVSVG